MNKELTPLEALEKYRESLNYFRELAFRINDENKGKLPNILEEEHTIVEKSLKALEIIKNKFHLHIVKDEKDGNFYAMVMFAYKNFPLYCIYETYDKEEYNLLKEVLLCIKL